MLNIINSINTAEKLIRNNLKVKSDEEVVIVADSKSDLEIVYALAGIIKNVGAEYTIAIMPDRGHNNAAILPDFINKGLESADVLIGLTRSSGAPCYSEVAQQLFYNKKIRSMSMVFRSLNHLTQGGATANYEEIAEKAEKLSNIWKKGEKIRITSEKGTDITAPIVKERVRIEDGFATEPGDECAFSDGEVFMYPVKGSDGTVVIDGPIYRFGKPNTPLKLEIKSGKVVKMEGGDEPGRQLENIAFSTKNADNFAEFAIGLNPNSLVNGDFEEEKKALGNVHFALGKTPVVYSPIHMDIVMRKGTVRIDNQMILENGKLLI